MRKLFINPPPPKFKITRPSVKSLRHRSRNTWRTIPVYDLYQTYQSSRFSFPGEKKAKETRDEKNCTSSPAIKYRRSRRRSRGTKKSQQKKDKKPCSIGSAGEGGEKEGGEEVRKRKEGRGGNGDRETRPSLVRRIIKNSPRGPLLLFRGSLNRL